MMINFIKTHYFQSYLLYNLGGGIMLENYFIDKKVILRKLEDTEFDYKLLEKWYQNDFVYLYFEQRPLNYLEIKNKYYPRTLEDASIPVYMIEYENRPIGIVQYKLVNNDDKIIYGLNGDNIYELDIFIGELDYQNKGLGKICIDIISKYLFKEKNANKIIMCPLKDNLKAINCYKKCGFIIVKDFIDNDTIGNQKEYVLMIRESNDKNDYHTYVIE